MFVGSGRRTRDKAGGSQLITAEIRYWKLGGGPWLNISVFRCWAECVSCVPYIGDYNGYTANLIKVL